MKRIGSTLYLLRRRNATHFCYEPDADGYLFANGIYRTKIHPCDLPECFVYGRIGDQEGYISAGGVKHLVYRPSYNSPLNEDDILYISYDQKIEPEPESTGGQWFHGYKHSVSGEMIKTFLHAAAKYSGYPTETLLKEVQKREEWYDGNVKKRNK